MINIDRERCTSCGICGAVCPRHIPEIFEKNGEKRNIISEEREELCMSCGHCTAVCPNDAIWIEGLDIDGFAPIQSIEITEDNLFALMEQRRSVRRYTDKPVSRKTLDRIIEASRRAPTGTARQSTGIIVIDNPETLETLSNLAHELYQSLDNALGNPMARFMIKRRVGARTLNTLQEFVMPGMRWYLKWKKEGRGDEILRDCKTLMLFHSPIFEPMAENNCSISAFHAILMAEVLGVGTCFNDLIPQACNRSQEIRKLIAIKSESYSVL